MTPTAAAAAAPEAALAAKPVRDLQAWLGTVQKGGGGHRPGTALGEGFSASTADPRAPRVFRGESSAARTRTASATLAPFVSLPAGEEEARGCGRAGGRHAAPHRRAPRCCGSRRTSLRGTRGEGEEEDWRLRVGHFSLHTQSVHQRVLLTPLRDVIHRCSSRREEPASDQRAELPLSWLKLLSAPNKLNCPCLASLAVCSSASTSTTWTKNGPCCTIYSSLHKPLCMSVY